MTGYKGYFDILWWKWYLVDLRDWYKPIVVKKHFNSKKQAKSFKKNYLGRHFEPVSGKEVKTYGVFKWTKPRKTSNPLTNKPKYDYPEDCLTEHQRKLFRNSMRRRMRTKLNQKKLREIDVWDLLDNKPQRFLRRLKRERSNHYICSKGNRQLRTLIGKEYPNEFLHLHIIIKTLIKYGYGRATWAYADVARLIYKIWGKRIDEKLKNPSIPFNHELVAEFKARGFIPFRDSGFNPERDNYVSTILPVKPQLVYPKRCYHSLKDKDLYEDYIYILQSKVGIPGYTKAHIAGLDKRK